MDRRSNTRLSKFLSLVLRHRPDDYGLAMDERGGVDLQDLIDVLVAEDILAEDAEEMLRELVDGSERKRFAIEAGRVRALYGHSARVRLDLPEHDPPEVLFHGTTLGVARRIQEEGIRPEDRAHVHLSATAEEALAVGGRHTDQPILLEIDTRIARDAGVRFSKASDVIWLSDAIPLEAIRFPELPEAPPAPARPTRPAAAPPRSPAQASVQEPADDLAFKRRTRKKATRR
jgi:putative RNA 2'-phosphotransferase